MLHNQARNLLVQAYEQTHDAQTVAKSFQVSTSTIYRLSGQMKKTGSVDLQTSQRGRKAALTEENLHEIDQLIIAQPDITIDEIIEKLGDCSGILANPSIRLHWLVFRCWYSLLISWIAIV